MLISKTVALVDPDTLFLENHQADLMKFSPFLCFPMKGAADEICMIEKISDLLVSFDVPIYLYKATRFASFFLDHCGKARNHIINIIDPNYSGEEFSGIPCKTSFQDLPPGVVFICETRSERIWRYTSHVPEMMTALSPEIAHMFVDAIPAHAWVPAESSIYPIPLPEIIFHPGQDVLLLDLPSRASVQFPVGSAYVRKALLRAGLKVQAFDFSIIHYHRYHIHRIFDLGYDPILSNQTVINNDGWEFGSRVWLDPRQWGVLYQYYAEDIAEIERQIILAKPKVLALPINSRNEWIARKIAKDVKEKLPEINILVGGHSCYTRDMGISAFPEHDYMVIGEADLVVGPLVQALAKGEKPKNLPGVVSRYDDPDHIFRPGPLPHNLDMLGGLDWDIFPNINQLYTMANGGVDTALTLTRGCVWSRCTFCAERFAFRSRTPKNYVDEIQSLIESGRPAQIYTSDSDFGGIPEVLFDVCEEILARNLNVNIGGQVRINKKFTYEKLKLMKDAGFAVMNFGADAFTENTIRLQRKGYTIETLLQNYEDAHRAGITVTTNIVIGVPGETDDDIIDTCGLIIKNKRIFPMINNINCLEIFNNSVYWYEPEKNGVFFYGDKEEIYKRYPFGIPQALWYSTPPFADKRIRLERMRKLIEMLSDNGVVVGQEAYNNYSALITGGGHVDFRALGMDPAIISGQNSMILPSEAALEPPQISHGNHLLLSIDDGFSLAFPASPHMQAILAATGRQWWLRRKAA